MIRAPSSPENSFAFLAYHVVSVARPAKEERYMRSEKMRNINRTTELDAATSVSGYLEDAVTTLITRKMHRAIWRTGPHIKLCFNVC